MYDSLDVPRRHLSRHMSTLGVAMTGEAVVSVTHGTGGSGARHYRLPGHRGGAAEQDRPALVFLAKEAAARALRCRDRRRLGDRAVVRAVRTCPGSRRI